MKQTVKAHLLENLARIKNPARLKNIIVTLCGFLLFDVKTTASKFEQLKKNIDKKKNQEDMAEALFLTTLLSLYFAKIVKGKQWKKKNTQKKS